MKFKKPIFWDLKKPNLISFFLSPFTIPIRINNFFLKHKSKKKNKEIKTICVGNIYLGGTGKTPSTIKVYEILKRMKFNVSTAKKFYTSQADEQALLVKKTKFITEKNRNKIISKAINNNQNIVIFDDGLQDRKISYNLEIVCFDSGNFIGNGCLIPSGPMREKLDSLIKYDIVFLKNDNNNLEDQFNMIKKYNPNIKIFETSLEISNLNQFNLNDNYLIFSGIGIPLNFKKILIKNKFKIIKEIVFPDHYDYKKKEVEDIINYAKNINAKILTTEKDFMKISDFNLNDINFVEVNLNIKKEEIFESFLKDRIYE